MADQVEMLRLGKMTYHGIKNSHVASSVDHRDCPLTLVTDAKSRTKSLYALAYGLSGGHAPRRPSCLLTRYLLLQKASPDFALLCHS
ncbi:hypothetical protein RO3G_13543 [Rhizopus delemar RA 99-880]|uniref:Uncharacterized protein n=1 Tax=Rhizopus delemar (strain RA 99-880 / ATCC MYA-4621 / FGSC 9543 / NRRL 43880) TaxID=246409 RepID=I1CK52_RHIO9|nr:hypothetical protein RO3G_13543 [Rhizopus delemar RA 99-880]|eukprot:EIE88832.1 hypothetical protein RO3G_13543 [Rhizopus delemar RA 99-880]